MSHLSAVADSPNGIDTLTRREAEVLALIAAGWSNAGICQTLFLSPKTVESHVHNIFLKLDARREPRMHARVMATRAWLASTDATARRAA